MRLRLRLRRRWRLRLRLARFRPPRAGIQGRAQAVPGSRSLSGRDTQPNRPLALKAAQAQQQAASGIQHQLHVDGLAICRPAFTIPTQGHGGAAQNKPSHSARHTSGSHSACGRDSVAGIGMLQTPGCERGRGQGQHGGLQAAPARATAQDTDGRRVAHGAQRIKRIKRVKGAETPSCRWCRQNRSCSSPPRRSSFPGPGWRSSRGRSLGLG